MADNPQTEIEISNDTGVAAPVSDSVVQAEIGIVTEAAPASDTASSGLNGRLQRIAQRLTSLIAQIPATLGQKTMSASLSVVVASDQSPLPITEASYTEVAYSASSIGFVPPTLATDVFTITGSATKTIKIKKIRYSISTTTGSGHVVSASIVKRSTVDTLGVRIAATVVPYDSASASGTATVGHYTMNPTLGTSVGAVAGDRYYSVVSGTFGTVSVHDFSEHPITLRGVTQQLALNLGGVTIVGPLAAVHVEWTES